MIKNYYENIFLYNFLLKIKVKNIFQLIKIKKICINIGFKKINLEKDKIINILLFFNLILNQKSKIIKSKKNNIILKIRKNSIISCKITLQKKNIYIFLEKLIFFLLYEKKKIILNKKKIINLNIINIFDFIEFKEDFLKIQNITPILNISIHSNNNNFLFLLLNYYFLLK